MEKNEKKIDWQKEKELSDKRLLNLEIVLGTITVVSFLAIFLVAIYAITELRIYVVPIILIVLSFAILIVGSLFCLFIEQKAGYYECKECHHKHVPTFGQICLSLHRGRTKHMKCPHCQKRTWHKKVLK